MKIKSKRNKARQLEFENFKSKQEKVLNLNFKKGFGGELQVFKTKVLAAGLVVSSVKPTSKLEAQRWIQLI